MSNAQEVVKRGYLTKSPPAKQALAKWKRRWCMLLDSHLVYPLAPRYVRLEYFDGEESQLAGKEPKGVIDLKDCRSVKSMPNVKSRKNVFDIVTADRVYHMSADSASERQEWLEAIRGILFSEEDTFATRPNLYSTRSRQTAQHPVTTGLSPTRHARSVRSTSPIPNRRAVESSQLPTVRRGSETYGEDQKPEGRQKRSTGSISERVQAAMNKDKLSQTSLQVQVPSIQTEEVRQRASTTGSSSNSPSRKTVKKLAHTESAQVGAMGDYDYAAPRRDSDSEDEGTGGPTSIKPQESNEMVTSLQYQMKSQVVKDLSESDEEDTFSSGPRSVIAQEPSRSEIQSDPLSRAVVSTVSAVAHRFSSHADIDMNERHPDYHNLSYPEDAPDGQHTNSSKGNFHDYQNLDYPNSQSSKSDRAASLGGNAKKAEYENLTYPNEKKGPNYQNLDYPNDKKGRSYQNIDKSNGGGALSARHTSRHVDENGDFCMLSFSDMKHKPAAEEEEKYDKLPSHSHLSSIAGTMGYSSVGSDVSRERPHSGPVSTTRRDNTRVQLSTEHDDYAIAAPHIASVPRHTQYDYVQPRTRQSEDTGGNNLQEVPSVPRHTQYDYVQPKPRPRKNLTSQTDPTSEMSSSGLARHLRDNYDYVVPGARLVPTQQSKDASDYDEAAPRHKLRQMPEVDGDYMITPPLRSAPRVDGDYDIVGFNASRK